jgi:hypothetical protein
VGCGEDLRRFESNRIGASNVMAGLDPATHAFAALNPPRVLLERRKYIPSDFCEVVANVDSSLRHAAWMAKPGQDVQAPRSASHGAVQLNSHPYKNPDGNLGKPKFIRIFLAKAEYCAIPLSLADRAYGGRLRMKADDPCA